MTDDVQVLGATGRTGRAITAALAARGVTAVLMGRDPVRLGLAASATGARTIVASTPAEMAKAIRRERPAVVVNTVGPFTETARPIIDAALAAGSSYLDLANDLAAVAAVLERDDAARDAGVALVTGAGFGVTATETVVMHLMEGRPPAARVRVDMIPSISSEEGRLGEALAETILGGIPGVPSGGRFQSRRIADGHLVPAPIGAAPRRLTTPDGDAVTTAGVPLGELIAAANATHAPVVESASSEAPSSRTARILLPLVFGVLQIGPARRFAIRRLAAVRTSARPAPRAHSWAHARVEWPDGSVREGWLRLGDGNDVTASVAAEVAARLAAGAPRPGAFTPAALFGTGLAEACGGVLLPL